MSIINDAIKKARKEFVIGSEVAVGEFPEDKKPPAVSAKTSEIKWTAAIMMSLLLVVILLSSLFLFRYMSRSNLPYDPAAVNHDIKTSAPPAGYVKKSSEIYPHAPDYQGILRLNGIVYGPRDKWAIINNKIAREGDVLLGGKLILIAEDSVKIRKNTGEEIVLDLK